MGSSSSRVVKSGLGGKERREGGREGGGEERGRRERGGKEGGREGRKEGGGVIVDINFMMDMIVSTCMLTKQTIPCCPCKGHPVLS